MCKVNYLNTIIKERKWIVLLKYINSINNGMPWNSLGNGGTNPATNFLGTTDNQSLVIRTNRIEAMRIDPSGNIGIGTDNPEVKLHVKSNRTRLESVDGVRSLDLQADEVALGVISRGAPLFINPRGQNLFLNPYGGNVGIGTGPQNPNIQGIRLYVEGDSRFNGHGEFNGYGSFNGDLGGRGYISKAGGGFKIDHPLDPANKYLNHGFVESDVMKNVYDGLVVLDENGEATIELPEWFEAVNQVVSYQLTAIAAPGPNLYIQHEISNNRFSIAGGSKNMKVSWQVTGIRKDPWAKKHSLPTEEQKHHGDQELYLHPDLYDQPQTKQMKSVHFPKMTLP